MTHLDEAARALADDIIKAVGAIPDLDNFNALVPLILAFAEQAVAQERTERDRLRSETARLSRQVKLLTGLLDAVRVEPPPPVGGERGT